VKLFQKFNILKLPHYTQAAYSSYGNYFNPLFPENSKGFGTDVFIGNEFAYPFKIIKKAQAPAVDLAGVAGQNNFSGRPDHLPFNSRFRRKRTEKPFFRQNRGSSNNGFIRPDIPKLRLGNGSGCSIGIPDKFPPQEENLPAGIP
jgi:hypothetical protein